MLQWHATSNMLGSADLWRMPYVMVQGSLQNMMYGIGRGEQKGLTIG